MADEELLSGSRLAYVTELTSRDDFRAVLGDVSSEVETFVVASRNRARRLLSERRLRRTLAFSIGTILVLAATVGAFMTLRARQTTVLNQRIQVADAWSAGQGQRGSPYAERSALRGTHHLLSAAALQQELGDHVGAANTVLAAEIAGSRLVATLVHPVDIEKAIVSQDGLHVLIISKSDTHDERLGVARVFRASDGVAEGPLLRHVGKIGYGSISRDGSRVLLATYKGPIMTWRRTEDPLEGWHADDVPLADATLASAEVSSSGAWIVRKAGFFSSDAPQINAFGAPHAPPPLAEKVTSAVTFNSDDSRILGCSEEEAFLFDTATGKRVGQKMRTDSKIIRAEFVGQGRGILLTITRKFVFYDGQGGGTPLFELEGDDCKVSSDFRCIAIFHGRSPASERDVELIHLDSGGHSIGAPRVLMSKVSVDGMCFSPDGSQLAIWDQNGLVHLWNASTGESLGSLNHGMKIASFAFDPTGRNMLTQTSDLVSIWRTSNLKLVLSLPSEDEIQSADFVANGTRILMQGKGRLARIWAIEARREAGEILVDLASEIDTSGDRRETAAVQSQFATTTLEASQEKAGVAVADPAPAKSGEARIDATFVGNDKFIFVAQRGKQSLRRSATGQIVFAKSHSVDWPFQLDRSEDGQTVLLTARKTGRGSGYLSLIWKMSSGEPKEFEFESDRISGSAMSPDGNKVAIWAAPISGRIPRSQIFSWDIGSDDEAAPSLDVPMRIRSAEFSRDGRFLLVGDGNKFMLFRWLKSGKLVVVPLNGLNWASDAVLSGDGKYIACIQTNGRTLIQRIDGITESFLIPQSSPQFNRAKFSEDSRQIVLWSDREFCIWDMDQHRFSIPTVSVPEEQKIKRLSFSDDGKMALLECSTLSDQLEQRIRIYRTSDGQARGPSIGFFAEEFYQAKLNPAGTLLLTVEKESVAKVWSTDNSHCIAAWSHDAPVSSAVFSRDGSTLLISCWDGTVRRWELGSDEKISIAQRIVEFEIRSGTTLSKEGDIRALSLSECEAKRRELIGMEVQSGKVLNYLGEVKVLSATELDERSRVRADARK